MNNIDKLLSYFYYGDKVKEIDFSNKEDVSKLKELLESLKSDVNPFSKFFLESCFGVSMEDLVEEVNQFLIHKGVLRKIVSVCSVIQNQKTSLFLLLLYYDYL